MALRRSSRHGWYLYQGNTSRCFDEAPLRRVSRLGGGIPTVYDPDHASGNPYLFTGRRWDAEISLYYYRARHYSPTLGRWLQRDPLGYADGASLYGYGASNPVRFVDPWGLTRILHECEVR